MQLHSIESTFFEAEVLTTDIIERNHFTVQRLFAFISCPDTVEFDLILIELGEKLADLLDPMYWISGLLKIDCAHKSDSARSSTFTCGSFMSHLLLGSGLLVPA